MPTPVLSEAYRVRTYDVGPEGRVSLPTLCNYLQDAASNHAQVLGVSADQLAAQHLTWFLHRLHVAIDTYPSWRDVVQVETWPSGQNGLYATREFLLHGAEAPVGRATSTWLLVDYTRRRPIRMPDFIRALDTPDRPRPLPDDMGEIPAVEHASSEQTFMVRAADLDLNAHANNVCYVVWMLETLADPVATTHRPVELIIHFRTEAVYGDTVHVQTKRRPEEEEADNEHVYLHRLVRLRDDRELARARSRWQSTTHSSSHR